MCARCGIRVYPNPTTGQRSLDSAEHARAGGRPLRAPGVGLGFTPTLPQASAHWTVLSMRVLEDDRYMSQVWD